MKKANYIDNIMIENPPYMESFGDEIVEDIENKKYKKINEMKKFKAPEYEPTISLRKSIENCIDLNMERIGQYYNFEKMPKSDLSPDIIGYKFDNETHILFTLTENGIRIEIVKFIQKSNGRQETKLVHGTNASWNDLLYNDKFFYETIKNQVEYT